MCEKKETDHKQSSSCQTITGIGTLASFYMIIDPRSMSCLSKYQAKTNKVGLPPMCLDFA
jgi:hypothetical protein